MSPGLPIPTVSAEPTAYPELRRALQLYLQNVGDLVELGRHEAAREALCRALAIRGELELTAR